MLVMEWEMSSEAVRAYIVTLRKGRGYTLDVMAAGIGMPRRTYIEWEQKRTRDLKTPFAVRAVRFLQGSLSDLEKLDELSVAEATALAHEMIANSTDSQREAAIALIDDLLADPMKLGKLLGYGARLRDDTE